MTAAAPWAIVVVVVEKSENLSPNTNTTRAVFDALLRPLEERAGRRFGNPHRREVFEKFVKNPDGVRAVAETSLEDANDNPLGLFYWRIKNGWHWLEPLLPRNEDVEESYARDEESAPCEPEPEPPRPAEQWAAFRRIIDQCNRCLAEAVPVAGAVAGAVGFLCESCWLADQERAA